MKYTIKGAKEVLKEFEKAKAHKLDTKIKELIEILKKNPFQNPPKYEKLVGDLKGKYSRRINRKHRIVYSIDEKNKIIYILSTWTNYEK